ncbi:MAG: ribosome-associated translation inhibitor RaiA [Clostridiales Family XIII bacterium]|jgi:putative sigma-54 modulation protein|nr:ribosome-associated translation inhibitor RaiA [Clostridiales Family XIII bacterium]
MKIIITSKNLNTSDHLKDTIESKMQKLGKYFHDDIISNVTLSMEKDRQKIEATINANGTIFRAEEVTADIYTGVDKVVDKLQSQMSKYKSKLITKHKDRESIGIAFEDVPDFDDDPSDSDIEIVKRKKFELLPMTAEEAVLQMELVGHTFFVYLDMDTDGVGVVYQRKDGKYGLLETSL